MGGALFGEPRNDPSQVAEPNLCESTDLEVLVGGVDDCPEGCSPVPAPGRDMTFLVDRGCDAHAVADPGADLGRFVALRSDIWSLLLILTVPTPPPVG